MSLGARTLAVAAIAAIPLFVGVGCDTRWELMDEPSSALLVNDLPVPVRLTLCDSNDCSDFHHQRDAVLDPGGTFGVGVSSVGVPNVYAVRSPDTGRRLGCLPLVTPYFRSSLRVRVSEHVPCRREIDEDAYWPARWEAIGQGG